MTRKIESAIRFITFIIKLSTSQLIAFILKLFPQYRNIWIISERGIDARDNGYFFYKYLIENHPDQKIIYIINSDSADFNRISSLGKWVEYKSFKHYIYYFLADIRISSSIWGGDLPNVDYFKKFKKFIGKNKKFVFLKHGIIKDYLPQHCYGEAYPDLYVCGAKPEYEYVKGYFGYPESTVKYLGLARFDNLHGVTTKKQILFMPTFRKWLQGKTEQEVSQSEYVFRWNEIINDSRLIKLLEDNDIKLVFYPHLVMQKYVDLFNSNSEQVKVAKFKDYDVQQLLIESKLLVTDFSSVFFDFGYMDKPVLYYQFDRNKYINEHYDFTNGYFSYDDNGFGKVVFEKEELVNMISEIVERKFAVDVEYKKRIDEFFPLKDKKNCERIYNEIQERLSL